MTFGAYERLTRYRFILFGKIRLLCGQMIQEFENLKKRLEHFPVIYLHNVRLAICVSYPNNIVLPVSVSAV